MTAGKSPNDVEYSYTAEILQKVRERLKKDFDASIMDNTLLDELLVDDDLLKRYVHRKRGDFEPTIAFILGALEWRKKFGMPEISARSFPREYYCDGGSYSFGEDVHGNLILHMRTKLYQKIPEINENLKKYTIFLMYRIDAAAAEKSKRTGANCGWVLLIDCTQSTLQNADLEMANFVNATLRNYFPSGQKYVLVVNLGWILTAIKNIFFTMLPANVKNKIKFCTSKNITSFIEEKYLPDYLGGHVKSKDYRWVPDESQSFTQLLQQGIFTCSKEGEQRVVKYLASLHTTLLQDV